MATRMQQRRGTASQWTTANPILAAGEIGFETDTNQFKMGDGTNTWSNLSYFKNLEDLGGSLDDYLLVGNIGEPGFAASLDVNGYIPVTQLGNLIGDAPEVLDTLEELADSLTNIDGDINTRISNNNVTQRTITNEDIQSAIAMEQTERSNEIADSITDALSAESSARTLEIANAIALEVVDRDTAITQSASTLTGALEAFATDAADDAQTAAQTTAQGYVSTHSSNTTNVHGISDTSALVTLTGTQTLTGKTISAADNTVTINAADIVDVTSSASELNILDGATLTVTELNYVDGVTSNIQTQLNAKAPLADPTFTGTTTTSNLNITGDLTVGGTTTTVNATDLSISDPLIYMSNGNWTTDIVDVGFLAATGEVGGTEGSHKHSGLIRDVSDSKKWKLLSNVQHPTSNIVDLTDAVYDTLKLGGVEFSDGTQTLEGVPSRTVIIQRTASNTLSGVERDDLIEMNSASETTVTIPTDATFNFPVGTSIDVLQTSTGQVTIAGAGGVTVNATPGLKLRTQWSSATLFKRAANTWVVFGDLTA